MSDGRTYKEWPRFVEKKARGGWSRRADIKHIDWNDMISLSQRVSILMRYKDRSDEFKDGIMAKIYHYVTGIPQIDETMRMWQQAIDNIHSYMNANKNDKNMRVFDCQDIMLLLLTISAMYDGPYKNIINILYGASDDAGPDTMPLDKKAKHIGKRHGIDIQCTMRPDIRNAAAHMSFHPNKEQGTVVIRFTDNRGKIETNCLYTREKLLLIHAEVNDAVQLLADAVWYWWTLEGSPGHLFDDVFFKDKKSETIHTIATDMMLKKENLNMKTWRLIMEDARRQLVSERGESKTES